LFHDHDGFWNLDDREDLTVRSRTGLRVPLLDKLSATAQLNLDWDREPAPGRKSTDATLLFGASYFWCRGRQGGCAVRASPRPPGLPKRKAECDYYKSRDAGKP
jgi:hypothetical protein